MSFRRVALVNRGDAAVRFLRAAREIDPVDGAPLQVVAFHTAEDRHAPFVRLADDAVDLGPARRRGADGSWASAYTDHDLLLDGVRASGCDALWPGWGFVAEDAAFVARLEDAGVVFLGPPSAAMSRLGDKIAAKLLATSCGVPLAPWEEIDPAAPRRWRAAAEAVGYPLMVKASAGGGGRGIRRVEDPAALEDAVAAVVAEAEASFGAGGVFLERCVTGARHVEVQFLVDAEGAVSTFGVRDCTVQRRHQKLIEESPSPVLTPVEEERLTGATARLVAAAGYRGVGTAEFLHDPVSRSAAFCEVNARLQVEHGVTEAVWGVDLVRAQIDIALGRPCDRSAGPRGWAVEARVVAEDAERGFAPAPGRVLVHRPPAGPGIRVDAGVRAGSTIPEAFDSLVAKVLAWGPTRDRALASLRRALEEYEVVVEDGATNRGVLLDLLGRPEVTEATATTDWLDGLVAAGSFRRPQHRRDALVLAAVELARVDRAARVRRFVAEVGTGVPRPDRAASEPVELELTLRGVTHLLRVASRGPGRWTVGPPGSGLVVDVEHLDDTAVVATVEGRSVRALVHRVRDGVVVDVGGSQHRVVVAGAGEVRAPGPALLVEVSVSVGDHVVPGQRVGTLEAMKTEAPLLAEVEGVVRRVLVAPGSQVGAGEVVVVVEPVAAGDAGERTADTDGAPCGDRSGAVEDAGWPTPVPGCPPERVLEVCDALIVGREVDPAEVEVARAALDAVAAAGHGPPDRAALADRLAAYAVVERLFARNLLLLEDRSAAVSAEAAFHDACRGHHRGEDGVRGELRPWLRAAVGLLGVPSLEPTDARREAMWRLAATRSRTRERERLMTSAVRAVAALVRGRGGPEDAGLQRVLADVERVATGSADGLADAAALARSELASTAAATEPVPPGVLSTWEVPALARYRSFEVERLAGVSGRGGRAVLARATSRRDPGDERTVLVVEADRTPVDLAEVSDADPVAGTALAPFAELFEAGVRLLRRERQRRRDAGGRDDGWWAALHVVMGGTRRGDQRAVLAVSQRFEAVTRGLALQELTVRLGPPGAATAEFSLRRRGHARLEVEEVGPEDALARPRSDADRRALTARRLGLVDPYELVALLEGAVHDGDLPHPSLATGRFEEWDLNPAGRLVPVQRPRGANTCGIVVGVVANPLPGRTGWAERVWIAGDPVRAMGSLGEAECRRVIAAIDLADERGLPVEWVALSSGARIAMDSGTENLDWTAAALQRIVTFTEAGGRIDVIVAGVNVGAQSYWNAEATMLVHTRGLLIMVPGASMVLTGRRALELSGSVGAEDEVAIGGYERVMGPNGQAQYRAEDLAGAYALLMDHHALFHPGADGRAPVLDTTDPTQRDVTRSPYKGSDDGFATVGEVFDPVHNPGRKRPFSIRAVMDAVADADAHRHERWAAMADAETAVVWETRLGGHAVTLIGMESRPLPRRGPVPVDGPREWAGGTLYPASSRKVARALRSASGNRPVVVLANLSGFDGSPESLRRLQLEHGAEIARAVVDFDGPIVFVVVGRYHGGAYVVFSKRLNPHLVALAVRGSYASVIGGAPAAAVVLTREVRARVEADPTVAAARAALEAAGAGDDRLRAVEHLEAARATATVRARAEVAAEFDAVHTVERAVRVGSLDAVVTASRLRPEIVARLDAARTRIGSVSSRTV